MEEYDISDIIKFLITANELNLQELVDYLQTFLIEDKANSIEQNFILVYQTIYENNSFLELQKYCTDLISKEPDKIFDSPNFSSIPEKLLISLIQNDNLQASGIVWENVLKWGLAQNPELPSDPESFSKDDFNSLKITLQQCIPFINFHNLTSKEFLDKVFPYEEILPNELRKDLLRTFLNLLDSNSKPSDKSKPLITNLKAIDSKIITYQHAELISKWIDKLEITDVLTSSYEFKLIFRGSRDGSTAEKFHEFCDNKSRTVTMVKVKDSNEILGGYNPIAWVPGRSSLYCATKDSFIFSFKKDDRIKNGILSRIKEESAEYSIYNNKSCGPSFGKNDLDIWPDFDYDGNNLNSYKKPVRETGNGHLVNEFVGECEVFQII